ncbi:MAG: lysophospholipid acyltransferase family protein [Pirellulaceae bacterium]
MRKLLWLLFKIFYRYEIYGRKNFPESGAGLICSNHQSHLDPMLVGTTCTKRMNFLGKKDLFRVPLLGPLIRFLDAIPIDREGILSISGIKETLTRLRRGELVLMFPEGTRTPDGTLQQILPGISALARRSRAPIVPVGVSGAFRAWPKSRKFPVPGPKIRVVIGRPIPFDEFSALDDDGLISLLQQRMEAVFHAAENKTAVSDVI